MVSGLSSLEIDKFKIALEIFLEDDCASEYPSRAVRNWVGKIVALGRTPTPTDIPGTSLSSARAKKRHNPTRSERHEFGDLVKWRDPAKSQAIGGKS